MVKNNENTENRDARQRDYAALVSFVGPIVVVIGLLGKFYVDRYRLDRLEERVRDVAADNKRIEQQLVEVRIQLASFSSGSRRGTR